MTNSTLKKPVRIRDIAGALQLSPSTVSRALAGKLAISEETRQIVQQTAVSMGYSAPQQGARRHKTCTRTVGILLGIRQVQNRFMTLLVEHLYQALREFGYNVVLLLDSTNSMTDVTQQLASLRPLIDDYLDGMIVASHTLDSEMVRELHRLGLPLVLVVRSIENAKVDTVEADNVSGGAEAARHLYELGHRRIALVMGPRDSSTSRDRARGALDFLRSVGIVEDSVPVMWNGYTSEAGYSCAVQLLSQEQHVTAIMAGNDTIALGVLEAARNKHVEVPQQLSVIGFDDIPFAGSPLIGLSTIQHPVHEIARTAARRLVERIRNGALTPPVRDVLPTQLIKRVTTAAPPYN